MAISDTASVLIPMLRTTLDATSCSGVTTEAVAGVATLPAQQAAAGAFMTAVSNEGVSDAKRWARKTLHRASFSTAAK
jgi:hypothetical protein